MQATHFSRHLDSSTMTGTSTRWVVRAMGFSLSEWSGNGLGRGKRRLPNGQKWDIPFLLGWDAFGAGLLGARRAPLRRQLTHRYVVDFVLQIHIDDVGFHRALE
jgi:hypothetical protein